MGSTIITSLPLLFLAASPAAGPQAAVSVVVIPLLLLAAAGIFWLVQLIDLLRRSDDEFQGRNDKVIWALVLIFLNFIGGLIYFFCKPSNPPESSQTLKDEYATALKSRP